MRTSDIKFSKKLLAIALKKSPNRDHRKEQIFLPLDYVGNRGNPLPTLSDIFQPIRVCAPRGVRTTSFFVPRYIQYNEAEQRTVSCHSHYKIN